MWTLERHSKGRGCAFNSWHLLGAQRGAGVPVQASRDMNEMDASRRAWLDVRQRCLQAVASGGIEGYVASVQAQQSAAPYIAHT
jgi:hypothetical protein